MRVRFIKINDLRHILEIEWDGRTHSVELETRSTLFHDLTHWAVEEETGLDHGFFGSLASGKTLDELKPAPGEARGVPEATGEDLDESRVRENFMHGIDGGSLDKQSETRDLPYIHREVSHSSDRPDRRQGLSHDRRYRTVDRPPGPRQPRRVRRPDQRHAATARLLDSGEPVERVVRLLSDALLALAEARGVQEPKLPLAKRLDALMARVAYLEWKAKGR